MDAFSPKTCWYSSWNSTMCCNFLCFASVQSAVSICSSSSVWMLLKSVPEVLSSGDDGLELEAVAVKINSKHYIVDVYTLVWHYTIVYSGIGTVFSVAMF